VRGPRQRGRGAAARRYGVPTTRLRNRGGANTLAGVDDSFREFEATHLFCHHCRRATAVRKKLLLVLPTGRKYDYTCDVCGAAIGGKTDDDATDFYRTPPAPHPGAVPSRSDSAARPGRGPAGDRASGR
jgi:hypothetical protein